MCVCEFTCFHVCVLVCLNVRVYVCFCVIVCDCVFRWFVGVFVFLHYCVYIGFAY